MDAVYIERNIMSQVIIYVQTMPFNIKYNFFYSVIFFAIK